MCKMYGENTLCRKDLQKVIIMIHELLSEPFDRLQNCIQHLTTQYSFSNEHSFYLNQLFNEFLNLFKNFESEPKIFHSLECSELLIKPNTFVVGKRTEIKKSIPVSKDNFAQIIPVSLVLKTFFCATYFTGNYRIYRVFARLLTYLTLLRQSFGKKKILTSKAQTLFFPYLCTMTILISVMPSGHILAYISWELYTSQLLVCHLNVNQG